MAMISDITAVRSHGSRLGDDKDHLMTMKASSFLGSISMSAIEELRQPHMFLHIVG